MGRAGVEHVAGARISVEPRQIGAGEAGGEGGVELGKPLLEHRCVLGSRRHRVGKALAAVGKKRAG